MKEDFCGKFKMKSTGTIDKEGCEDVDYTCKDSCLLQDDKEAKIDDDPLPKSIKILFTINVYAVFFGFVSIFHHYYLY